MFVIENPDKKEKKNYRDLRAVVRKSPSQQTNTRIMCGTAERRHWYHSGVFIVNFELTSFCSVSNVDFEQVNVC